MRSAGFEFLYLTSLYHSPTCIFLYSFLIEINQGLRNKEKDIQYIAPGSINAASQSILVCCVRTHLIVWF